VRIDDTTETRTPYAAWPHQPAEIRVTAEQDCVIKPRRQLQHVHRDLDIHVALHAAAAGRIGEFPRRLGHQRVAVVGQPVRQRLQWRVFVGFQHRRVVIRADDVRLFAEKLEKVP
jgi:hypothetical protein